MVEVKSFSELENAVAGKENTYLLLYKSGTDRSDCAHHNLSLASASVKGVDVYYANVATTRDIHERYEVTSVPTLIEFENGKAKNVIKGCNDDKYYKALLENALYLAETKSSEKPQKQVTVYSTPTCSWCNTLKAYLRKHRIRFNDVDVSRDQNIAEELVRRSGQRGVPQTDIGGEIVVGFNQARINELLQIRG
ncbi:MAG TPA: glutaredoxin domain-containing protein [Tenuifilaceae bacterium]|nr:glutaredoxin domain-containing protein [Tenuifilaceae bacterium]HPJ44464.1 glutaredoxin domain-containing protein [Tenuifilaceae bacterium]HRX69100.1 glutaredoxin domain-containing protein [Tenuifilaceae bacterium]